MYIKAGSILPSPEAKHLQWEYPNRELELRKRSGRFCFMVLGDSETFTVTKQESARSSDGVGRRKSLILIILIFICSYSGIRNACEIVSARMGLFLV